MDQPVLHTPVLFIIFNRPETTQKVFDAIRIARPTKLYVAADGPRPTVVEDFVRCREARAIIDQVDWECEVKTLYQKENLNCGLGPSSAFNWFFDNEEEGIILEDDCLPDPSFFGYCQELLERYRHDTRVMHIGGNNFLKGWKHDHDYSYYFSRSGYIWGWATWRRAWLLFDYHIDIYRKLKEQNYFQKFFLNAIEKAYRLRKFDHTVNSPRVDWWDYQWDFARFVNSGLAIVPNVNLVQNLGFGTDGTHTQNANSDGASLTRGKMPTPLRHPPFMIRDFVSDKRYFLSFMKDKLLTKLV
jgi:hypothetical protein